MLEETSELIIGRIRYHFNELYSSNTIALSLAPLDTTREGTCIITDYQLQGKGQYGRTWVGEKNKNVYTSIIIYPPNLTALKAHLLNCIVCLSIIDLFKSFDIHNTYIKWPNDIYCNDKKIAGVLIQNILKGEFIHTSVLGIGININQKDFLELSLHANSLANILQRDLDLVKVYNVLYKLLDSRYNQLKSGKEDLLVENFNQHIMKNKIECRLEHQTITATIHGLSQGGKIICESNKKQIEISPDQIINR